MIIWESDEIKCRSPNFVTLRKNCIWGLSIDEEQNGFEQLIAQFYTDFNTGKLNGVS